MEHRPGVELESALVGAVDAHAQKVGGHHVVGELHAAVVQPQHRRHAVRQRGFAHARHVFQQHVAVGENAGEKLFEHGFFAQNQLVELGERGLYAGLYIVCHIRNVLGGCKGRGL